MNSSYEISRIQKSFLRRYSNSMAAALVLALLVILNLRQLPAQNTSTIYVLLSSIIWPRRNAIPFA